MAKKRTKKKTTNIAFGSGNTERDGVNAHNMAKGTGIIYSNPGNDPALKNVRDALVRSEKDLSGRGTSRPTGSVNITDRH